MSKTSKISGTIPAAEPITNVVMPAGQMKPGKYRVHLFASTPLETNPLVVEADDQTDAWEKFCKHNGIAGSIHQKTIEYVGT